MVRVIFHAGLPKTGSSSVQQAFADRREALAAEGFFYPAFDAGVIPGHWTLGALWRDRMPTEFHLVRRLDALGPADEVLARVRRRLVQALRQAEAHGAGVVLLSDEHFGHDHALAGCRRLAALLERQGAELRVLAYARPDPQLLPSWVQQQLKTYGRSPDAQDIGHLPRLKVLAQGFGAQRLQVRVFAPEALEAGDAVTDLCGWIGREAGRPLPDLGPVARTNEAIPAAGCALLLATSAAQRPEIGATGFAQLRWATMTSLKDLGAAKLTLPAAWEARIQAQVHRGWNAMLETTDHPPALRARLRMPELPPAPALTSAELRDWIASARDPAYEADLAAWLSTRPERQAPKAAAALSVMRGLPM